ncbi:hypothetical protein C8E83_2929 [Frondihabitans australicus]|uniref:Uncharacterized protein n=1 Tax=Frondihabitans australicus TaxID=386892 RepID=A0A495IIG2_9MICO|nr:hypothetical protein C8E83_2929 [Frondihabitans australicus]
MIFLVVMAGLAVLIALALVSNVFRRRHALGLTRAERAERSEESREGRHEADIARTQSEARTRAGSGSAQTQTRQF